MSNIISASVETQLGMQLGYAVDSDVPTLFDAELGCNFISVPHRALNFPIQVISDAESRAKPVGFSKVLELHDMSKPEVLQWCTKLSSTDTESFKVGRLAWHPEICGDIDKLWRKNWEWSIGMAALTHTSAIKSTSRCLGIGAGMDLPMYYLSLH